MINYQFKEYTKEYCINLMKQICKENNLKLIFLKKDEGKGGYNYGCSSIDEIMLAPFIGKDHLEKQFISFFHEFAHLKLEKNIPGKLEGYHVNNTSTMQYELWVTMLGINYAKEKYGIIFSDEALQWLIKQNFTYMNSESGENCWLDKSNKYRYILKYYHIEVKK